MNAWCRELAIAAVFGLLLVLVGWRAPGFFRADNLRDLLVYGSLLLLPAIGMTVVILTGEIDISIGSQVAVGAVVAGLLAKAGVPTIVLLFLIPVFGGLLGFVNGVLVAYLEIPSIIVTLGTMVGWRAVIRWATEGAWVRDLPDSFVWFGLGQNVGQAVLVLLVAGALALFAWLLSNVAAGRAVYAVGADRETARLVGIRPKRVVCGGFVALGLLTGLYSLLHAVRFLAVQPNSGVGLELQVIACVVVGGTSILGGRGTLVGTLLGVALFGTIGTMLTFLHIDPAWARALQGAVIVLAVALDRLGERGQGDD